MGSLTTPVEPVLTLPNLLPTLGAIFLGGMAAAMLYGAASIQVYVYFQSYKNDGMFLKCAVVYIWLLDTLHMAIAILSVWNGINYLIASHNGLAGAISWFTRAQLVLTVVTILSVRSLYTIRVWKLSQGRTRIWTAILIIVFLMGCAGGIILIVEMNIFTSVGQIRWSIELSFILSTVNDILLAAWICYLLYPEKEMLAETKSMVWTIIRYVIISGALTSMCSVAGVTTFFAMPNNDVFFGITFVLPKLHVNSYLAMLNARKSIRSRAEPDTEAVISTLYFRSAQLSTQSAQSVSSGEVRSQVPGTRDKGVRAGVDIARRRGSSVS